jgi:hypothetical protein
MKRLAGIIGIGMIALALLGCPEKKGPLEKAGEKMDDVMDDMGDAVEDAADEVEDAVDDLDK